MASGYKMADKPVIKECNVKDFFTTGIKVGFYIKLNELQLTRATVISVNYQTEEFSTTNPTIDLEPVNLNIGLETVAQIYTEFGIVRFPTTLLRIKKGPPNEFFFTLPEMGKHLQYRKYPRVDIFASFRIVDPFTNKPIIRSSAPYPVNVSSGGIRFEYETSELIANKTYHFDGRLHYFNTGGPDNRVLDLNLGLNIMQRQSSIKTQAKKTGELVAIINNKIIVGKWVHNSPDDIIDINEYVMLYLRRFKKHRF